jgi:hypothetical protein
MKIKAIKRIKLKTVHVEIHAKLMKILKFYLKVKFCKMKKKCNLHIANGTNSPCKLPNKRSNMQINSTYCVSQAVEIW